MVQKQSEAGELAGFLICLFLIGIGAYALSSIYSQAVEHHDNLEIEIEKYNEFAGICELHPDFKKDVNVAFENDGKITNKESVELSEKARSIRRSVALKGFMEKIK